ncbi:hypothetical protein LXL04_025500 [Taraxacum kok-saghyz]
MIHRLYETRDRGKAIPRDLKDVTFQPTKALFVLLVEKEATFWDNFYDRYPSIIITGEGQPDVATRQILKKIKTELHLPILLLMDYDSSGIGIMTIYSTEDERCSCCMACRNKRIAAFGTASKPKCIWKPTLDIEFASIEDLGHNNLNFFLELHHCFCFLARLLSMSKMMKIWNSISTECLKFGKSGF